MLVHILTDIAKDLGVPRNDNDRAVRLLDVNNAIRELHAGLDLPESLDEEVYDINIPSQQIVLPAYVDKVIGMRYADNRVKIQVDSRAARYNDPNYFENEVWYLQWRDRGWSALSREIVNQSAITVAFPTGLNNGAAFTVTITGQTDKATQTSEVLTFAADDNSKVSTMNWVQVKSIVKSATTQYDLIVTDADDNELAVLPNSELISAYRNFQYYDTDGFTQTTSQSGIEVMFKRKFFPLSADYDNYFGTDRYDKAIYWKFMELRSKNSDDAVSYHTKCSQLLGDLLADTHRESRAKINFSSVAYFGMPYYSRDFNADPRS